MGGQLKEVRSRIGAVKSTQQITKAMKLVAASKLRKAQDRIIRMRPYANKLYEILGNLAAATEGDVNIAYAEERAVQKVLLVVLTSDRGLCGGFNSNIIKLTKQTIKKRYSEQRAARNVSVLCIGKKGYEQFKKEADLNVISDYVTLFENLKFEDAVNVGEALMNSFVTKDYDVVEVIYARFKNQITQLPTVERFLPIQKIEQESETTDKAKTSEMRADFIFEPDEERLLKELVPKILKTRFYRFMLDSNASEQGARMTSMANATENAEELLRELKIQYNRARQAAITTELTEIVSGAAALQGS